MKHQKIWAGRKGEEMALQMLRMGMDASRDMLGEVQEAAWLKQN